VAGDELIRSYARELSAGLGGRASSISAEVLDHLVESVDARVAGGLATFVASAVAELSSPWDGLPRTLGNVGGIVVTAGAILGAVGAAGLLRRQGRVSGWSSVAV
jgi:hypothetical protein